MRIDVGTAATAPNSAFWLLKYEDTGVIGFEPNKDNYKILLYGTKTNQYLNESRLLLGSNLIKYKNKILKHLDKKIVFIFNIGIDNVKISKKKTFYNVEDKNFGCSSFNKPLEDKLKIKINKINKVKVNNLKYYLNLLDKKRFEFIDFLKTDTQGNDLKVLKSCGDQIRKICFIQTEYWSNQHYHGDLPRSVSLNETIKYMKKKNFYCYYYTDVDAFFINKSLKSYINKYNILDDCIDFKTGLYHLSKWPFNIDGKLLFIVKLKFLLKKNKFLHDFFKNKLQFKVLKFI